MDAIIYENIRVSGYELTTINELEIESKVNEHSTLKLSGVIDDSHKDKYIDLTYKDKEIEVYVDDDKKKVLFHGYVTNVEINVEGNLYTIKIEAKSMSYLLDIEKVSRSYQNTSLTYSELIKRVLEKYKNINYRLNIPDIQVNELLVQYEETDWQFLIRLASRFNEGIYVDNTSNIPQFHIGIPEILVKLEEEIKNYNGKKCISEYKFMKNNYLNDAKETDYITFKIKTYQVIQIGSYIKSNGHEFYVYRADYKIEKGMLVNTYYMRAKNGIRQKNLFNTKVCGSSIDGKIIGTQGELVQIHLDIDKVQNKSEAHWFKFSTMSASSDGTGWYCMPEVGDSVRLYFPTKDEYRAFAVSAVSGYEYKEGTEGGDLMGNPDDKYLRNSTGNEVKLTPEGIFLSCNGGQAEMSMKSDGTVSISSKQNVSITAEENLNIEATKKFSIKAKEDIKIESDEGGSLEFDPAGQVNELGAQVNNK